MLNVVSYLRKGKGLVIIAGVIQGDPTAIDNLQSVTFHKNNLI
jgi:hypothetical protein